MVGSLGPGVVLGVEAGTMTAMEEEMATTKKKGTAKKAAARTKKAPVAKAKKDAEPKSKAEKPGRVFAFRLTTKELEAIHRAAGSRNASRFIRRVAGAFAAGDESAFRAVVKEARAARG